MSDQTVLVQEASQRRLPYINIRGEMDIPLYQLQPYSSEIYWTLRSPWR